MSASTESRSCPVCGKPTNNPKFCSRSCSAQATNRERPKRKPEGSCEKCGTSISTRHRLCSACQQIATEERVENEQNIRSFRTLAGQVEKERVARVYVHQETVFDCGHFSDRALDPAHPIGDLIQVLLGILDAKPAYVRSEDAPRFACLLRELREYEAEVYDKREAIKDRVGNLPIRCLDQIWERWVNHFFDGTFHPLLPTYALGLAQFVEPHIYGQTIERWGESPWRIVPLVRSDEPRREGGGLLRDTTFKREFTQQIKGLEVVAKIPDGCALYDSRERKLVVDSGEEFSFSVLRGHLTAQGYYDMNDLVTDERAKPQFDIAVDFQFRGHLAPHQGTEYQGPFGRPELEIPIRWITHAKVWNQSDREEALLPVPQWHA